MKTRIFLTVLVLAAVCFAIDGVYQYDRDGDHVNPGQVFSLQSTWSSAATWSMSNATTTPAVGARTTATFTATDPNNATYTIPPEWNAVKLRCSGVTDSNQIVVDVFLSDAGTAEHFNRVATLTWTTGTQTAGTATYEFCDTLVESNSQWHVSSSELSPASNYIAEWALDVQGAKVIGFSPTTVNTNAVLEIRGF